MSENSHDLNHYFESDESSPAQPQNTAAAASSAEQKTQINSAGKKVIGITCLIIGVIFFIFLINFLAHKDDLKYTTKSLTYIGNLASATVEVENNTNDFVAYTLDFQVWDRYGELVGYQYMTIRMDPNTKKEYEIVAYCSTWDLEGSHGEVRVF